MLPKPVKTAIFDLGNVIVFFSTPKMIAQLALCTGLSQDQVRHLLIDRKLQSLYESGQLTSEDLYRAFLSETNKKFTREDLFYAASDIFIPNTPIFPLIEHLKKQGIRLLLLSNTSEAHYHFIAPRLPIIQLFDAKILSYQVQAIKPQSAIYHEALAQAQCKPKECFYTDDIPEYIAAAKTHGIDAVLFTDVADLSHQLAVRGY